MLLHPQLVRKPRIDLQLAIDLSDVAQLEKRPEAVGVPPHHGLAVAGTLAELDHLVGDRQTNPGGVRPGRDEDLALHGGRQGAGRIDLPGDLDRLVHQPLGLDDVVVDPVELG